VVKVPGGGRLTEAGFDKLREDFRKMCVDPIEGATVEQVGTDIFVTLTAGFENEAKELLDKTVQGFDNLSKAVADVLRRAVKGT